MLVRRHLLLVPRRPLLARQCLSRPPALVQQCLLLALRHLSPPPVLARRRLSCLP